MPEKSETDRLPFHNRLSRLMAERNASQQAVADAVGVSRQAVAQWKEGKTVPDMYNFQRLAGYFQVPYEYLLGDTESIARENMALSDNLGLSDKAIDNLRAIRRNASLEDGASYISKLKIASQIIASDEFEKFLALVQASALDYRKFEESLRCEQIADIAVAERCEEQAYSATGRAVVDMGEMSAFHLYRAQALMKEILERIPEERYHDPLQ